MMFFYVLLRLLDFPPAQETRICRVAVRDPNRGGCVLLVTISDEFIAVHCSENCFTPETSKESCPINQEFVTHCRNILRRTA